MSVDVVFGDVEYGWSCVMKGGDGIFGVVVVFGVSVGEERCGWVVVLC